MIAHLVRLLAALGLVLAVSALPLATVSACSCAFLGYPEAVAEAELAFIGTVTDAAEPAAGVDPTLVDPLEVEYAFSVERAKSPMPASVTVRTVLGDGGNCGLDMDVGQRWLVIARAEDGIRTDLCTGSTLFDGLEAELQQQISNGLSAEVEATAGSEAAIEAPPWGVIGVGAVVIVVAAVSFVAFGGDRVR